MGTFDSYVAESGMPEFCAVEPMRLRKIRANNRRRKTKRPDSADPGYCMLSAIVGDEGVQAAGRFYRAVGDEGIFASVEKKGRSADVWHHRYAGDGLESYVVAISGDGCSTRVLSESDEPMIEAQKNRARIYLDAVGDADVVMPYVEAFRDAGREIELYAGCDVLPFATIEPYHEGPVELVRTESTNSSAALACRILRKLGYEMRQISLLPD